VTTRAQHNGRVTTALKADAVVLTRESAQLLYDILGQTTLAVGSPDFAVTAPRIAKAKAELMAELGAPGGDPTDRES
jgi:hypothetical protein